MKRYWYILKKYKKSLFISPFLIFIFVVCETIQPYLMSKIIDNGLILKDLSVIIHVGVAMILVSIVGLVANISNVFISSRTSTRFGTDLRNVLFSKIQQFSFTEIDNFSTASLITRLTNDISKIQQLVLMSMRILLRAPMMLGMASLFVLKLNSQLALIMVVAIPVLGIGMYFLLSKAFPLFIRIQQKVDNLNGVVRENLLNIRVVKSFVREDFEQKKFEKSSDELKDIVIKASNTIVTVYPLLQFVMNASVLAILWFGGQKVSDGEMYVGQLISFVNYFVQILMSLMIVSMMVMAFARAAASSKRVLEVLVTEPSLVDTTDEDADRHKIEKGEVVFKDVYFRYYKGENDVLKNINFRSNAGETIAVVGATGAAKSSLLQLIPRLYDVSAGEILIDGINVKDYKNEELHHKIGMVFQVNELFSGTIADNLRWGKPEASQEELEVAARAAEAHGFIESFPDGYNTVLERGGGNLSGGQKQRLCLARALLRRPKILILDDSTSAVDTETEKAIRENLRQLLGGTTVFIVTQRVYTMQAADRVIVLEDGEIDAMGKPSELMEKSKSYQEIYYSQQVAF